MEFRGEAANRLHENLWPNMPGEVNDGPACRCSRKAQETGIRHGFWIGETPVPELDPDSNNYDKLFHYRQVPIISVLRFYGASFE
jgi:ribonuclease-3